MPLTKLTASLDIVSALEDEPNDVGGLSAAELKAKFDEAGNVIKTYLNDTLTEEITAENVPFAAAGGREGDTVQAAVENVHSQIVEMAQAVIPNGSVTSAKLASSAVTEGKIAAYAVTAGKLGSSAVTSAKIAGSAVTSMKIASGAVTEEKLAPELAAKINAAGKTALIGETEVSAAAQSAVVSLSADLSTVGALRILVFAKNYSGSGGGISFNIFAGESGSGQQMASGSAGASGELGPAVIEIFVAANSQAGCELFSVFNGASSASASRYSGAAALSGAKLCFAATGSTARFAVGSRFMVYAV